MKGYRFYLEYPTTYARRKDRHSGCVIALAIPTTEPRDLAREMRRRPEGAVALYDYPNSPVCYGGVSRDYLRKRCKRISEKRARDIHPNLFNYLESS